MEAVKFSRSVSACELNYKPTEGCLTLCGMCPCCVFSPNPPGSTRRVWKVSDDFKRRFIVDLVLRCTNTQLLGDIQSFLSVTSWTFFTYARSMRPVSPQDYPSRSAHRAGGKPLGMDVNEIRDWFLNSPDHMKSRYLFRIFSFCDSELLRIVANLTSVLLVRQKGFLRSSVKSRGRHDEDSEEPALMVVPGSSKSLSGVSRYRDFIGCLPVDLAMRILGLLDEPSLKRCQKVCRYWKHLALGTMKEKKHIRKFQDQVKAMMKRIHFVSPTYANIVEVPVPVEDDENVEVHPSLQKVEPFEAAYAKVQTKTVKMEERNVYCDVYFTTVLLDKEDPHRVVDYRGGSLMATGSKDRMVRVVYVGSEVKVVSAMKGHVGRIQAVLLCQDRHLVITASCDATIRCWCLKTDKCVKVLYGHAGTVNCLDVHADRLVSGAKDRLVKGKQFENLNFKHLGSVQCVKINTTTVYSSCDRGLVKIWDIENASLSRVIDAHRKSVMCLFFDEWHLLSGDSNGQVMAWSTKRDTKQCLMTFNHPKEVKSLTLVYLRVITGCVDGKIRIFNFLTGDCLKEITAETETGRILSVHFHDGSILVNTRSTVTLYQFAKVFWNYADSSKGGQGDAPEVPLTSAGADHMARVASPSQKRHICNNKNPERAELLHHSLRPCSPAKFKAQAEERHRAKQLLMLSEKATSERMKRRGLHHPLTRDAIFLRVNAAQKAQCMDEVSINMEYNARLRDSWGPNVSQDPLKEHLQSHIHPPSDAPPRRAKTCVPILRRRPVSQYMTNTTQGRAQSHSADTHRRPRAPECSLARSLPDPECSLKTSASLPSVSPAGPFREQRGSRLLTVTQLKEKLELMQSCEQKLSKKDEKKV